VVLSEYDWNFAEAERSFRRAIDLNPNYPTAHHWYGEYLMAVGRFPEALTEIRRAQDLDPLSLIINGMHGVMLRLNGRHDEAFVQLKRTTEMDPNFVRTHIYLAELYQDMGRYEDAADEFYKVASLNGAPAAQVDVARQGVIDAYRREGPKGYFRTMAAHFEAVSNLRQAGNPPPVTVVAACWLHAGEKDRAYELLEEGLKRRDPEMLRVRDPRFNTIKDEERFREIVRRIGLPD
jgi:tetratricopeptide (TPR) repeat protein